MSSPLYVLDFQSIYRSVNVIQCNMIRENFTSAKREAEDRSVVI